MEACDSDPRSATTDAAVRRVVNFGVGWTAGGLPPDQAHQMAEKVRAAWKQGGRAREPRFVLAGAIG